MLRATVTIILSFAVLITIGTALLSLPISTVDGKFALEDAFFTATSAVCVTGLIVADTATKFTIFGQVVILILFQLGGLGIITFSVVVLLFLGRRISLLQREVISSTQVSHELKIDIKQVGKPVLAYLIICEVTGAVILFFAFIRHFPWNQALYHAVFHSISAFCNAGFSTFSDSMTKFGSDLFVMLPMMSLIILGGLGFVVVLDLNETLRFGKPITLHTKLVLLTSLVLIAIGALLFFVMENGNILHDLSVGEKVTMSIFHSVTTRTAGFNSTDYYDLTQGTLMITMILMIIGGSPGSTAGGIKTTTVAIIFLTAWARLRGKNDPEFANRAIASRSVVDALTLVALSTIFIIFVVMMLQITETGTTSHEKAGGSYLEFAFEGSSAFGTVGLSMGATPNLSLPGKILISATMFIGRLGPLTFFYLLGSLRRREQYRLYSETVMVG